MKFWLSGPLQCSALHHALTCWSRWLFQKGSLAVHKSPLKKLKETKDLPGLTEPKDVKKSKGIRQIKEPREGQEPKEIRGGNDPKNSRMITQPIDKQNGRNKTNNEIRRSQDDNDDTTLPLPSWEKADQATYIHYYFQSATTLDFDCFLALFPSCSCSCFCFWSFPISVAIS